MGIISSRAVLLEPRTPTKSSGHFEWQFNSFFASDRLVRHQLRKEVQRGVFDKESKARDRVSLLQVTPESLQQEDVRPVLPLEAHQVPRH